MRIPRRRSARRSARAAVAFPDGELVTVRAYAGSRADEEPRAIVIGGREVPVDEVEWRATVEASGERRRVFVVHAGGARVRLAHLETEQLWEIERTLPSTSPA